MATPNWANYALLFINDNDYANYAKHVSAGLGFEHGTNTIHARISVLEASRKCWTAHPPLICAPFINAIASEVKELVVSSLPSIDDLDAASKAETVKRLIGLMIEIGSDLTAEKRVSLQDLDAWSNAVLSTAVPAVHIACTQFLTLKSQTHSQAEFDNLKKEGSRLLALYLSNSIGKWIGLGPNTNTTGAEAGSSLKAKAESEPLSLDTCFVPLLTRLASVEALENDLASTNAVWKYLVRLLIRDSYKSTDGVEMEIKGAINTLLRLCESARLRYASVDFQDENERLAQRQLKVLRFFLGHLVTLTRRFPHLMPDGTLARLLIDIMGNTPSMPRTLLPSPNAAQSSFLAPAVEAVLTGKLLSLSSADSRSGERDENENECKWQWKFIELFKPTISSSSTILSPLPQSQSHSQPQNMDSSGYLGSIRCCLAILLLTDRFPSNLQSLIVSNVVPWILDAVALPKLKAVIEMNSIAQIVSVSSTQVPAQCKNVYDIIRDTLCAFSLRLRVALFDRIEILLFNYAAHPDPLVRLLIGDWWCFIARHSRPFLAAKHSKMLWELVWATAAPSGSAGEHYGRDVRVYLSTMCGRLLRQMPAIDAIKAVNLNDIDALQRDRPTVALADVLLSLPLGDICISQIGGPSELRGYLTSRLLQVACGRCLAIVRDTGPLITPASIEVLTPLRLILSVVRHKTLFPQNTPPEQRQQTSAVCIALLSRLRGEPSRGDQFALLASTVLEALRYVMPIIEGNSAIDIADVLRFISESCPQVSAAVSELSGMLGKVKVPQMSLSRAQHIFRLLFHSLIENSSSSNSMAMKAAVEAFRQFAAHTMLPNLEGFVPEHCQSDVVVYLTLWPDESIVQSIAARARQAMGSRSSVASASTLNKGCWSSLNLNQGQGSGTASVWDDTIPLSPTTADVKVESHPHSHSEKQHAASKLIDECVELLSSAGSHMDGVVHQLGVCKRMLES